MPNNAPTGIVMVYEVRKRILQKHLVVAFVIFEIETVARRWKMWEFSNGAFYAFFQSMSTVGIEIDFSSTCFK